MFFFNKPPKWNECKSETRTTHSGLIDLIVRFVIEVQAFVLNFNGRVDKASVKNF